MRSRLDNVQALRAVAALMVLVGHVQHEALDRFAGYELFDPVEWGTGVDVFFVISGFIMYYIAGDQFGRAGASWAFLKRRLIRVVPVYWLFTAAMLGAIIFLHERVTHNEVSVPQVVASFLFLPWPRPDGSVHPILSLGWTLNYEMMFYGAFSLALLAPKRIGLGLLCAAFAAAAVLHPIIPRGAWMFRFLSNPIILEFLLGIGLAHVFLSGVRMPTGAGLGLAVVAVGAMIAVKQFGWLDANWRPVWAGLPALTLCSAVVLARLPSWNPMTTLGDASYSLYLSHPFAINAVAIAWGVLGGTIRGRLWGLRSWRPSSGLYAATCWLSDSPSASFALGSCRHEEMAPSVASFARETSLLLTCPYIHRNRLMPGWRHRVP